MPGASYMVSNMSSTSFLMPASTCLTGSETSRSLLSGSLMISRRAMVPPKYLAGDVRGVQSGVNARGRMRVAVDPWPLTGYDRSLFVPGAESLRRTMTESVADHCRDPSRLRRAHRASASCCGAARSPDRPYDDDYRRTGAGAGRRRSTARSHDRHARQAASRSFSTRSMSGSIRSPHRSAIRCRRPRSTPPRTCKSSTSGLRSSTARRRTSPSSRRR